MHGARFDRFVRMLATRVSRRGALAAAGAMAFSAGRASAATPAKQLTPPTCGSSGDVCTMLVGCCDGLTCVTSAINTNYGVCVAGEGGTVSIGTTLISPFSENVEQEVAAIAASETSTSTATTTTQSEQEVRQAEIKARKDARQSKQKTRRTTKKTEQETRRDDRKEDRELRLGPKLEFELTLPVVAGNPEVVRIRNRDDSTVYLMTVEPLSNPRESSGIEKSLFVDDSLFLLSGLANGTTTDDDEFLWFNQPVCQQDEDDGFLITAGFSSGSNSHEYFVMCDGSVERGGGNSKRKKRRRKQNSGKNRN